MAGFCDDSNALVSVENLYHMNNCHLFKEVCVPVSWK
jgi:hypothetical protein